MKIEHMREFVMLTESRNFSETADRCYISQSALSKHIFQIESEMGSILLKRSTHTVKLTEAGKTVYEAFRDILRKYDETAARVRQINGGAAGNLTFGLTYYGIEVPLQKVLIPFMNYYHDISVRIESYQPYQIAGALENEEIDSGYLMRTDGLPDSEYTFFPLFRDRLKVIVNADRGTEIKEPLAEDFFAEKTMISTSDTYYMGAINKILKRNGLLPERTENVEQIDIVSTALQKNSTYFWGPGITLANMSGQNNLLYLDPGREDMFFEMGFYVRTHSENVCVRTLSDYLKKKNTGSIL